MIKISVTEDKGYEKTDDDICNDNVVWCCWGSKWKYYSFSG